MTATKDQRILTRDELRRILDLEVGPPVANLLGDHIDALTEALEWYAEIDGGYVFGPDDSATPANQRARRALGMEEGMETR